MFLLSADYTVLEALGYSMSLIELVGTVFGLISVYLASRAHIATWPTGMINQWSFFILFWQLQLYSVALLQLVFFAMAVYGWVQWAGAAGQGDKHRKPIGMLSHKGWWWSLIALAAGWLIWGTLMTRAHHWMPAVFPKAATAAYFDALIAVASVIAITLMARKVAQCWLFWILVNSLSVVMYVWQGVLLVALEFVMFLILAVYGYRHWCHYASHKPAPVASNT